MTSGFSKLTQQQPEQLLIHLFQKWLVKVNPGLDANFVPQKFLPLVAKAMRVLHAGQKDNPIYLDALENNAIEMLVLECHWIECLYSSKGPLGLFLTVFCNDVTQLIQIKFEIWWFFQC